MKNVSRSWTVSLTSSPAAAATSPGLAKRHGLATGVHGGVTGDQVQVHDIAVDVRVVTRTDAMAIARPTRATGTDGGLIGQLVRPSHSWR